MRSKTIKCLKDVFVQKYMEMIFLNELVKSTKLMSECLQISILVFDLYLFSKGIFYLFLSVK